MLRVHRGNFTLVSCVLFLRSVLCKMKTLQLLSTVVVLVLVLEMYFCIVINDEIQVRKKFHKDASTYNERVKDWPAGTGIDSLCARIHSTLGTGYEYDENVHSFIRELPFPKINEESMSEQMTTLDCGIKPAIVIIHMGYINTFYIAEENKDEESNHSGTEEVDTEIEKLENNEIEDSKLIIDGEKENKVGEKNSETEGKKENVTKKRIRIITDEANGLSFIVRKLIYLTPIPYPNLSKIEMKKMYKSNKWNSCNSSGTISKFKLTEKCTNFENLPNSTDICMQVIEAVRHVYEGALVLASRSSMRSANLSYINCLIDKVTPADQIANASSADQTTERELANQTAGTESQNQIIATELPNEIVKTESSNQTAQTEPGTETTATELPNQTPETQPANQIIERKKIKQITVINSYDDKDCSVFVGEIERSGLIKFLYYIPKIPALDMGDCEYDYDGVEMYRKQTPERHEDSSSDMDSSNEEENKESKTEIESRNEEERTEEKAEKDMESELRVRKDIENEKPNLCATV